MKAGKWRRSENICNTIQTVCAHRIQPSHMTIQSSHQQQQPKNNNRNNKINAKTMGQFISTFIEMPTAAAKSPHFKIHTIGNECGKKIRSVLHLSGKYSAEPQWMLNLDRLVLLCVVCFSMRLYAYFVQHLLMSRKMQIFSNFFNYVYAVLFWYGWSSSQHNSNVYRLPHSTHFLVPVYTHFCVKA